jgi:hypothetical protein
MTGLFYLLSPIILGRSAEILTGPWGCDILSGVTTEKEGPDSGPVAGTRGFLTAEDPDRSLRLQADFHRGVVNRAAKAATRPLSAAAVKRP